MARTRKDTTNATKTAMKERAANQRTGSLVRRLRRFLPEELASEIDGLLLDSVPSLIDLYDLETVMQALMMSRMSSGMSEHTADRLHSVALQSRKNMRQLVVEMGDGQSIADRDVPVPEWLSPFLAQHHGALDALTARLEHEGALTPAVGRLIEELRSGSQTMPAGDAGDRLV